MAKKAKRLTGEIAVKLVGMARKYHDDPNGFVAELETSYPGLVKRDKDTGELVNPLGPAESFNGHSYNWHLENSTFENSQGDVVTGHQLLTALKTKAYEVRASFIESDMESFDVDLDANDTRTYHVVQTPAERIADGTLKTGSGQCFPFIDIPESTGRRGRRSINLTAASVNGSI